jgi:predicted RNA methylase
MRAGKVVLDVGTGSGLLAFFAVQAGAKIVYAVEASDSAAVAMDLCKANGMEGRVKIIKGKIEEVCVLQHTHSHTHLTPLLALALAPTLTHIHKYVYR